LVTWDYKAQKYKPILNKNGKITNQYHGRIFIKRLSRCLSSAPRYIPVYKAKEPDPERRTTSSSRRKRRNN
ncbi:34456_t:CDS:1, partial [Gigaspora margarita]